MSLIKNAIKYHNIFSTGITVCQEKFPNAEIQYKALRILYLIYVNWVKFIQEAGIQYQNSFHNIGDIIKIKKDYLDLESQLKNKYEDMLNKEKSKLNKHQAALKIKQFKEKYQELKEIKDNDKAAFVAQINKLQNEYFKKKFQLKI